MLRILIASTLLAAAIGKLLDNRYAAGLIGQWNIFPQWSLLVLTLLLSLSELILALWLFSGKYLNFAALTAVAFHGAYTLFTLIALFRGTTLPDCGCFGILYPHPLNWIMAVEDFGFTLLSFVLYRISRNPKLVLVY